MRLTTQLGSISGSVSGVSGVPGRIWRGAVTSTTATIVSWPVAATDPVPDGYNLYRSTDGVNFSQVNQALVVPTNQGGAVGFNQIYYVDGNTADPVITPLALNTNYTYRWTSSLAGVESLPGPTITVKTLNGTNAPPALPLPPVPFSTWGLPFVPRTGTVWTATITADTVNGIAGTGAKFNVGCSYQYALSHCQPGDAIICTAGAVYTNTSVTNAWNYPIFPGATTQVYVYSSEAPEIKTGGALPAFSFIAQRNAGNNVTAANLPAMPQFMVQSSPNLGNGHSFPGGSGYFRFIGCAFVPEPNNMQSNLVSLVTTAHANFASPNIPLCNHIYWDRCYFGNKSQNYLTNFSMVLNGILSNIAGLYVHQCCFEGFYNGIGEAHCISLSAGGPVRIDNTYLEAVSEQFLTGGLYTVESQNPTDGSIVYNTSVKQPFWFNTSYGSATLTMPPLAAPVQNALATAASGGSIANGTYFVKVQAIATGSASPTSTEQSITTTGTGISTVSVSWTAVAGATGYNVYFGTTAGNENVFATLGAVTSNTFTTLPVTVGRPPTGFGTLTTPWPHQLVRIGINFDDGQTGRYGFLSDNGNGTSNITWDFISGTPGTTVQLSNPMGLWAKNHFEMKIGLRYEFIDNFIQNNSFGVGGQQQGSAFLILPRATTGGGNVFATNPWDFITDVLVKDNVIENCGQGIQYGSADNARATSFLDRIQIVNNEFHLNPFVFITQPTPLCTGYGITNNGPTTNVTIDKNTVIICPTNINPGTAQNAGLEHGPLNLANAVLPQDVVSVTNNILDGKAALRSQAGGQFTGTAAFNTAFSSCVAGGNPATQPAWAGNVTVIDGAAYPAGTVATNVGYANLGMAVPITNNANPPVNPSDWDIVSGPLATASTSGGPIGFSTAAPVTQLQITTASLAPATVGVPYSQPISVTGGTPPYTVVIISAKPHRGFWGTINPSTLALQGTPQYNETCQFTLGAWDSTGAAAQQVTLPVVCKASGSLTVVTQSLPAQTAGGKSQWQLIASGGVPPYVWGPPATINAGNFWVPATGYSVQPNGFMTAGPAVSTVAIAAPTVQDSTGASATGVAMTATLDSTLRFDMVDTVDGIIRLPVGEAGQLYGATGNTPRFTVAGGTAPYTFSGTIAGITVGSDGQLKGTMPTTPGTYAATITVNDSASHQATATAYVSVVPVQVETRPAYNTGSSFFVKKGKLWDPNGRLSMMRGYNRDHYDVTPTGWSKAFANACRDGSGLVNGSVAVSTYVNDLTNNLVNAKTMPLFPIFYDTTGNTQSTGSTDATMPGRQLQYMFNNIAAFQPLMNKCIFGWNNEWGTFALNGPAGATPLANAYTGVIGNISAISGTTITINTVSATNPFLNSPFAFIAGNGANTSQVVNLSSPGGSSGAWTVTSSVALNASAGGGTLNAGVAGWRAAGFTGPIVIDAPGGSDWAALSACAQQIQQSDPFQSVIFSWHGYAVETPFEYQIKSVTPGATTVLTLNCTKSPYAGGTLHPFSAPSPTSGPIGETTLSVVGATGVWSVLNGNFPCPLHGAFAGGTVPNATVTINVNTTGLSAAAYVANSAVVFAGGNSADWAGRRAADQANNICWMMGEFGNFGTHQESGVVSYHQVLDIVQNCDMYGIGWQQWAWDDAPLAIITSGAAYTNLASLTVFAGQPLLYHPRISCQALSIPFSVFLP